jgi:hypothetical protein
VRQLNDHDGAVTMHLVGEFFPTLGESRILISSLMTAEPSAQGYFVGCALGQRQVEKPGFAPDPAGTADLGAMGAMK